MTRKKMKKQSIKTTKNTKRSFKLNLTLICLFLLGIVLTPLKAFAGETINGSIMHDGLEREYILYVPDSYSGSESVPLVLNFHGAGGTASGQMYAGDFRSIADTAGFLVVHPQGVLWDVYERPEWNVGGWTSPSTVDDVGFTEALIDALASEYNIDAARVYATGLSLGGHMSFLLACELGDKVAAIASVSGTMFSDALDECIPHRPIPILQIHGTDDSIVPYVGTGMLGWTTPIDEVLEFWVNYNNCNPVPAIEYLPDIAPNDGSTVEHHIYDDGDNGVTVEHYKVIGGGHAWPGSVTGFLPWTNQDIDASEEIWSFFSKFDINGRITPDISVDLALSKEHFQPGDAFILTASISNPGPALDDQPFAVLLEVAGSYFWYPSWTQTLQYDSIDVDTGVTDVEILNFTFPDVEASVEGARFYGALLSKDLSSILGDYDMVEFGWGE